jgi:hypothetical protein
MLHPDTRSAPQLVEKDPFKGFAATLHFVGVVAVEMRIYVTWGSLTGARHAGFTIALDCAEMSDRSTC